MAREHERERPIGVQSAENVSVVNGDLIQIQKIDPIGNPLERAMERLAEDAGAALLRETERRSVWRPAPISLRVRSTERPVQAPPEILIGGEVPGRPTGLRLTSDVKGLTELFLRLPHRQLALLGDPGAGKTVLAMLLTLDLLKARAPDAPVPVFFSVSSWNPATRLDDWMAACLTEDHPFLADSRVYGEDAARRLIDTGRILPVLDGLDEVATGAFKDAVERVDVVFGDRRPFVVTCRADEFETAVLESGKHLSRAVVLEIEEVDARTAAGYLRATLVDDGRWRPLLGRLAADPEGPLAEALNTPLMLYLVRVTYEDPATDPAELLDEARFGEAGAIEDHLLDAFVPAVYGQYHGLPYTVRQARRWLGTLAHAPKDLRWWNLTSVRPHLYSAALIGICAGWIAHLAVGPGYGVMNAILAFTVCTILELGLLQSRVEIVTRENETDPRSHLRGYRSLATFCSTAVGVLSGGLAGLWLGSGAGVDGRAAQLYAVGCGILFGATTLISAPWGSFCLSRLEFALRRRLPPRLLGFMEDAHERGVLRKPGAAYQFRHARLQERLRSGGPNPFKEVPHRVTDAEAPRPKVFAGLLQVPLLRLLAQLAAVGLLTLLTMGALSSVELRYVSGDEPETTAESACTPTACASAVTWHWSLPPASRTTSRFSLSGRRNSFPYEGLGGRLRIEECPGASVEISVQADTAATPSVQTVRGSGIRYLEDLAWQIPGDPGAVSITFRRVDSARCTAELGWEAAGLSVDSLFRFKSFFA